MTLSALDPVIHPPARLQICALLAAVTDAEFATVRDAVGVSDSVLSKHLAALSEAGYLRLRKAVMSGRQRTWASLTREGRAAFAGHIRALQALAAITETMDADPDASGQPQAGRLQAEV